MTSTPCREPGCLALAVRNDLCAVHAAGYRRHDGSKELRCWYCRRVIAAGDWYRKTNDVDVRHIRTCTESPAAVKARAQRKRGQRMGAR